jgi:hypothetical protein
MPKQETPQHPAVAFLDSLGTTLLLILAAPFIVLWYLIKKAVELIQG